jgi:hypothetical protein
MKNNVFVFDVESTSLHGEGFAFGVVVTDRNGNAVDHLELLSKEGAEQSNDWVKENVLPHLQDMPTCETNKELRDAFYEFYMKHKETADIWSDCNFPVETNFLSAIVRDDIESRQWNMPYPLKDISTVVNIDINRIEGCNLLDLRKHNPLDDAIASLHYLIKAMRASAIGVEALTKTSLWAHGVLERGGTSNSLSVEDIMDCVDDAIQNIKELQ